MCRRSFRDGKFPLHEILHFGPHQLSPQTEYLAAGIDPVEVTQLVWFVCVLSCCSIKRETPLQRTNHSVGFELPTRPVGRPAISPQPPIVCYLLGRSFASCLLCQPPSPIIWSWECKPTPDCLQLRFFCRFNTSPFQVPALHCSEK